MTVKKPRTSVRDLLARVVGGDRLGVVGVACVIGGEVDRVCTLESRQFLLGLGDEALGVLFDLLDPLGHDSHPSLDRVPPVYQTRAR